MKGAWITIGSFDGVHLGHQKIINNLVEGAKRIAVPSIVVTFFPHPATHIKNITDPYYLTSPEEKDQILYRLGINSILTMHFNHSISQLSPQDFISTLHHQLKFSCLLVGYNFRLGVGREGDLKKLKYLGNKMGVIHTPLKEQLCVEMGVVNTSAYLPQISQYGKRNYCRRRVYTLHLH
jgi:riboflavin kinase/FMN adenylyltransferase